MSDLDDATQATVRKFMLLGSVALSAARITQQQRARRAQQALRENQARRNETIRQLQAERALSATQWTRAFDPQFYRGDPDQLAQAWASAKAWESLDPRAARAAQAFDERLRTSTGYPHIANAPDSDDYAALALLLNRAEHDRAGPSSTETHADPAAHPAIQRVHAALGPERAEPVIRSAGWNALNNALDQAAEHGYSPELLLRTVYDSRPIDNRDPNPARDVGVVLHWRVERHLNDHPTPSAELSADRYQSTASAPSTPPEATPTAGRSPIDPQQLRLAGDLVTSSQFGSRSMLQRKMNLDQTAAERLLDSLHEHGIVGPREGNLAREVLAQPRELDDKLGTHVPSDAQPIDTASIAAPQTSQRHEPALHESDATVQLALDPLDESITVTKDVAAEYITNSDPNHPDAQRVAQNLIGQDAHLDQLVRDVFPTTAARDHDTTTNQPDPTPTQTETAQPEQDPTNEHPGAGTHQDTPTAPDTNQPSTSVDAQHTPADHHHQTHDLDNDAYQRGSPAAQLAGKSFPRTIRQALAHATQAVAANNPKPRRATHKQHQPPHERGR